MHGALYLRSLTRLATSKGSTFGRMRERSKLDIHHANRTRRPLHKIETLPDRKQYIIKQHNIRTASRIGIPQVWSHFLPDLIAYPTLEE